MYITRVILKNIRCCKKIKIDFAPSGSSVLFTGDNGTGKTTILRAIAMGLCDVSSAGGLLRELYGNIIRKGCERKGAEIIIGLIHDQVEYTIKTQIASLHAFEQLSQKVYKGNKELRNPNKFPWGKLFVAAYGAGSRSYGTSDFQHYTAVDAVYPLFNYDVLLQNPELSFRRVIDEARLKGAKYGGRAKAQKTQKYIDDIFNYIEKILKKLLNLSDDDKIELTSKGIEVKSHWGQNEVGVLGDGYKAVITWLFDFISWWMLYLNKKSFYSNRKIRGIVLLDEIEQHLHPIWQTKFFNDLEKLFPNVQFITSTHSPLVSNSFGQFFHKGKEAHLVHLELNPLNEVTSYTFSNEELMSLKGLDYDQILASRAFDYLIDTAPELNELLRRASKLASKGRKRTPSENKKYNEIKITLSKIMSQDCLTEIEREIKGEKRSKMLNEIRQLEKKIGLI